MACDDAFYVDWLSNRRSKLQIVDQFILILNFLAVAHANDQTRLEPQTDDGTVDEGNNLLFTC